MSDIKEQIDVIDITKRISKVPSHCMLAEERHRTVTVSTNLPKGVDDV